MYHHERPRELKDYPVTPTWDAVGTGLLLVILIGLLLVAVLSVGPEHWSDYP